MGDETTHDAEGGDGDKEESVLGGMNLDSEDDFTDEEEREGPASK